MKFNVSYRATSNFNHAAEEEFFAGSQFSSSSGFNHFQGKRKSSTKKSKFYMTNESLNFVLEIRNEVIELSDTENVSTIRTDKNDV